MKITQEGDHVRLVLMVQIGRQWFEQFNFTIHKSDYKELKNHIIEALEEFEVK